MKSNYMESTPWNRTKWNRTIWNRTHGIEPNGIELYGIEPIESNQIESNYMESNLWNRTKWNRTLWNRMQLNWNCEHWHLLLSCSAWSSRLSVSCRNFKLRICFEKDETRCTCRVWSAIAWICAAFLKSLLLSPASTKNMLSCRCYPKSWARFTIFSYFRWNTF